jgi:hypothetical protein
MWTVPSAETEIFRFDLRAFEALLKAGGQRPPVDKQDKYEKKSKWVVVAIFLLLKENSLLQERDS